MKFTSAIAALAVFGAASAAPVELEQRAADANLPGLNAVQSANARAVIAEVKKENMGKQGCLAAISTGLTEASMLVYANSGVAASLKCHHDAVGSDHDSVGIFQQRVSVYKGPVCDDMDPAKSAAKFLAGVRGKKGWQTMDVGKLDQSVQGSAYPDRYDQHLAAAKSICAADGF